MLYKVFKKMQRINNSLNRLLYVAIGDEQEKDSFSVPLCQVDGKSCGTSFIHTFKLQKWHSIGLYIRLVDENDTLTVLEGTRFSIVLLGMTIFKLFYFKFLLFGNL